MKKKVVSVIVALVLIAAVGLVSCGKALWDKYSYGRELADMDEYYGVGEGELAVILQDARIDARAVWKEDAVYFDLETVSTYFNDGFYVDRNESKLLYTTANDTAEALLGARGYSDRDGSHTTDYSVCYEQGDKLYIAADYVRKFTNYSYTLFDRHLQVYTEWGERQTMEVEKNTQIRLLGGIKSPILRELEKGETVELLEETEDWSKVKTSDSIIGYVENKRLTNWSAEMEEPVTDYVAEEYTSVSLPEKVSLGWHYIRTADGNDSLDGVLRESGGSINVIAPTWFSLTDNEGNFRSLASGQYVRQAHSAGLQVWGVWDNFNYRLEMQKEVDSYQVLSYTGKRRKLAQGIAETAAGLGLDGVNIDFEGLRQECGEHYIQFLKELSVLCRSKGLALSVDNPVPFDFNRFYRLDIQGQIADYVIIMGYDEHWSGSGNPGSVASIGYVSDGIDRALEQVPAAKVVNALPFYTFLWKTDGATVTDDPVMLNEAEDLKSDLARRQAKVVWDAEACQNYAEWQEDSATYQIWLEDKESIIVKLNVMNAKKIGGVAVWRLGYGTSEVWSLIRAYRYS